jgi:CheY-like chemotaxis protein
MGGETIVNFATVAPSQRIFSVLVVEDDVLIRLMIADRLRDSGLTVVEAFNADEAITILQSQVPVDLVFTDVRMPGSIDGVALAKLVRETRPEIKLVISSGHAPVEDERMPADAVFRKPYDLNRVVKRIEELLAVDTE